MGRIDHHEKICTLQTYLLDQGPSNRVIDRSVRKIINGVAVASKMISREASRIGLSDLTGETGTINVQGEMVQKLDIYSEKVISEAMVDGSKADQTFRFGHLTPDGCD